MFALLRRLTDRLSRSQPTTRRRCANLGLERLEGRENPAAFFAAYPYEGAAYRPLSNNDLNLQAAGLNYNQYSAAKQQVTVTVGLTDFDRVHGKDRGGFEVRLLWADANGNTTFAGNERFIKTSTPAWGPSATVSARFGRSDLTPRPANARYLVAVVDPNGATRETSENDNIVIFDLVTKDSFSAPPPSATPRTFAFLISGFSTSSGARGMGLLKDALDRSNLGFAHVDVINGSLTGQAIYSDAVIYLRQRLKFYGATPQDRVVLIGHSYGGDAARRLAADARPDLSGAQPAAVLITIDPIDYLRTQTSLTFNQSGLRYDIPAGVAANKVFNIVQRTPNTSHIPGQPLQGYQFTGGALNTELAKGKDHIAGNRDDLTHTTIDDDSRVHNAVVDFLRTA